MLKESFNHDFAFEYSWWAMRVPTLVDQVVVAVMTPLVRLQCPVQVARLLKEV